MFKNNNNDEENIQKRETSSVSSSAAEEAAMPATTTTMMMKTTTTSANNTTTIDSSSAATTIVSSSAAAAPSSALLSNVTTTPVSTATTPAAYGPYLGESHKSVADIRRHSHQSLLSSSNIDLLLPEQLLPRPSSAHSAFPSVQQTPMPIQQITHYQQQQQQQFFQPLSSRKLFIGGLGQINDDELRQYYTQWGQVIDCIVIRDPTTRSSRGFGFVTYSTSEMADAAIAHQPHVINGKSVDAKRAVPREKMNPIPENGAPPPFLSIETTPGCRLQISGLNWERHKLEKLRKYFEDFGPVEQIEMLAYPRGFGSISFERLESVDRCLAAGNIHNVEGCTLEVKLPSDSPSPTVAQSKTAAVIGVNGHEVSLDDAGADDIITHNVCGDLGIESIAKVASNNTRPNSSSTAASSVENTAESNEAFQQFCHDMKEELEDSAPEASSENWLENRESSGATSNASAADVSSSQMECDEGN